MLAMFYVRYSRNLNLNPSLFSELFFFFATTNIQNNQEKIFKMITFNAILIFEAFVTCLSYNSALLLSKDL